MICLNRLLAKQLRAAMRRTFRLSQNAGQQVVWLETTFDELRVFSHHANGALEYRQPGIFQPERLPITLATLAACEGNSAAETVKFTRQSETHVTARWFDRNVPQSLTIDVAGHELEPQPAQPETWAENSPRLISALAEAMEVTDTSSTRYTLGCVQLRAEDGRIAATDSSQLLVQHGFSFPWDGEVLVPRTNLFKLKELWSSDTVRIGKTKDHVVFEGGPWMVWQIVQTEGRFPRVEDIIPAKDSASTRMVMAEREVEFFLNTVPRLPCDASRHKPMTVELNGHVALLARADDSSTITRAILSHARREGDELRWLTNRDYLLRAVKLGFREVELRGNEAPAVCRDANRAFVWSLLAPADALLPSGDVVDVVPSAAGTTSEDDTSVEESTAPALSSTPFPVAVAAVGELDSFPTRLRSRTSRAATNRVAATFSAMDSAARTVAHASGQVQPTDELTDAPLDLVSIAQEVDELRTSLRAADSRIGHLIAALQRQHQRI